MTPIEPAIIEAAIKIIGEEGISDEEIEERVAGMSPKGRQQYLEVKPGDYDELNRRLHLFRDSPEGGDAEAMLFLRLFEDADGKTIAASHSARPFADGRSTLVPGQA